MTEQIQKTDCTRSRRCPILILGLGNILLTDEGVGVRVVQALEEMNLPSGVELFDGGTGGLDLMDVMVDRQKVIVIDAINSQCDPGTILRLTSENLDLKRAQSTSVHGIGFLETLALARELNIALPELVIIGVQPKDLERGLELSPELARLMPRIIERVLAEL